MVDLKQALSGIGTLLTGTAMGMQGRGAEFAQGLERSRLQDEERRKVRQMELEQTLAIGGRVALNALKAGDTQNAFDFLSKGISGIKEQFPEYDLNDVLSVATMIRTGKTDDAIKALSMADQQNQLRGLVPKMGDVSDKTAAEREFASLTKGMSDDDIEKARRVKLGLDPRASVRLTPEQEAEIARSKAEGKQRGEDIESRRQKFIDSGIQAADGSIVIRRAINLLDSVKTGGIDNALLNAKKFFGVEGADEAELSANLGKSVLSQLRDVFGAAFTEKEGQRLERIEAGFGKSTEGNKRLLNQVLKIMKLKTKRGLKAAKDAGDDIAIEEIKSSLNFDLSSDSSPVAKPQRETITPNSQPKTNFGEMSDDDLLRF